MFFTLLGACSKSVPISVSGTTPEPLINTIPITMGVIYDDEFKSYVFKQTPEEGSKWRIEPADLNIEFLDRVFNTMFRHVSTLDEVPTKTNRANVQAVLHPSIEEFGFLTPKDTGLNSYSASIKYRIDMFTPTGELIASWPIIGYGKSIKKGLSAKKALNEASRLAIRDGAATIAIDFQKQTLIRNWLIDGGFINTRNELVSQ